MGSIYWQFNDIWPVASWSSVDSNLRYKALHYFAKKFYAPVEMGLFLEGECLTVNLSNETRKDFRGEVRLVFSTEEFGVKSSLTQAVAVKSLSASDVLSVDADLSDPCHTFAYAELYDETGAFLCRNTQLFVPAKHFAWKRPNIKVSASDVEGGVALCVSSDTFAKGVYLDFDGFDAVLSDNFFELTNGEAYTVVAKTDRTAREVEKALQIMTVYDIGR